MTDNLQELYNNYLEFTDHMVGVHGPMEVAAIMMAQALSIYRTGLNDEEYNQMVDSISANRNRVHTFEKIVTQ
jgi:hypothetical protein